MKITCCKDCLNRHIECHVNCKKYKQEKADIATFKININKQNEWSYYRRERMPKVIDECKKGKRKK